MVSKKTKAELYSAAVIAALLTFLCFVGVIALGKERIVCYLYGTSSSDILIVPHTITANFGTGNSYC